MANMNIGVFTDREHAEAAIHDLEQAGFNPKEMSLVMQDSTTAQVVAEGTGVNVVDKTAAGVATGGVLGGIAGLLVGIGAISVPGIGALLIGGPIAAALGLTGAAATTVSGAVSGALAGGFVGALIGLGIPEDTAKVYEDSIKSGGILLAVPSSAGNSTRASMEILEAHGAQQLTTVNV
jgi:hypothetical protein